MSRRVVHGRGAILPLRNAHLNVIPQEFSHALALDVHSMTKENVSCAHYVIRKDNRFYTTGAGRAMYYTQ